MFQCTNCGTKYYLSSAEGTGSDVATRLASNGWTRQERTVLASGNIALPAGASYTRRQPARAPATSDVKVTLAYSTGSAAILSSASAVLALMAGKFWVFTAGLALGAVVAVILWFTLMFGSQRLLWLTEEISGQDIKDGHRGRPPGPRPETRGKGRTVIYPYQPTEDADSWYDLPATKQVQDLKKFALVVMRRQGAGANTGQKAMRGYVLPSRFELSDELHKEFCSTLHEAGFARPRGQGAGWEIIPFQSVQLFQAAMDQAIQAKDW